MAFVGSTLPLSNSAQIPSTHSSATRMRRPVRTELAAATAPTPAPVTTTTTTTPSNSRIGVIGGGPAGIAAAWFLRKKGYHNVTVLEKESDVGGKCKTVPYTDSRGTTRNFELGAEYITYAYDTIFQFMDEVGEQWSQAGAISVIQEHAKFAKPLDFTNFLSIVPALLRYFWVVFRYRAVVASPSNKGIAQNKLMSQSTEDFIKNCKLEPLRNIFLVRQFGYGTLEDFPTIHLLRTVPLPTLIRILVDEIPIIRRFFKRPIAALAKDGTQGLFKKMALDLNRTKVTALPDAPHPAVVTDQEVIKIETGAAPAGGASTANSPLVVHTSSNTYEFDKVICALPPVALGPLMNGYDAEEKALLGKMKFDPYYVGCIDTDKNLPKGYYQNISLKDDEPVQFSKRFDDCNIYAYGYNWLDAAEPDDPKSRPKLERTLKEYLAQNMDIHEYSHLPGGVYWSTYHPHVSIADYQSGYFDKLEQLQGKFGVYLTGDGMADESMEFSCRYSKLLIDTYF